MREHDKGWKSSRKLQAAIAASIIICVIYLDNRHNPVIADHILSIGEIVIVAALGGRIGMSVTQEIVSRVSQEFGQFNYTPDPKDVDDGTVS